MIRKLTFMNRRKALVIYIATFALFACAPQHVPGPYEYTYTARDCVQHRSSNADEQRLLDKYRSELNHTFPKLTSALGREIVFSKSRSWVCLGFDAGRSTHLNSFMTNTTTLNSFRSNFNSRASTNFKRHILTAFDVIADTKAVKDNRVKRIAIGILWRTKNFLTEWYSDGDTETLVVVAYKEDVWQFQRSQITAQDLVDRSVVTGAHGKGKPIRIRLDLRQAL